MQQTDPAHAPIHVTLYHGAKRPEPTRQDDFEGGWEQLVESLQELVALPPNCPAAAPNDVQKEAMVAWSPHRLAKPYRHLDNVAELTLMVIDVDRCNLLDLCDNLEAMGWAALIYSSPSDSEDLPDDARRVRVVSPISRAILPSECDRTRFAYAECLGLKPGQGVEGAKDAAKLFFIGQLHGSCNRLWATSEGSAVDVDDLLSLDLEHDWGHSRGTSSANSDGAPETFEGDRRLAMAVAVCENRPAAVEGQQGHRALYAVFDEVTALYPRDPQAVADICWEHYNPRCLGPWPDSERSRFNWEAKQSHKRAKSPDYIPRQRDYDKRLKEWEAEDTRREALEAKRAEFAQPITRETDQYGGLVDWGAPITPLRYLCEGLGIGWVGKVAGVHGYAGTSKGLFVARLMLSAAAGLPFLGHNVKRVPVVYYDCETGEMVESRIKRLAKAMGINLGELEDQGWWHFRHTSEKLASLIESGSLETHCREVDKGEGVALGLDSYSSMVEGNENDSEYADPLWALGRMCRDANVCPVVVMHDRKSQGDRGKGTANALEGVSGTNRLAAALASSIRLTPSEDNDRVITVACTRAPEKRFEPIELTWADVDGGIAAECEAAKLPTAKDRAQGRAQADADRRIQTISKRSDAIESLLHGCIADNMTAKKIRSTISLSGDDWIDVRRELLRRGSVIENKTGKFPTYRLVPGREVKKVQHSWTKAGGINRPGGDLPPKRKLPLPVSAKAGEAENTARENSDS